jgi:hypothetical protein
MLLTAELGLSRASSVHTVKRNFTGDEGRSFEFDNQVLISSHRKRLWSKAMVVRGELSGMSSSYRGLNPALFTIIWYRPRSALSRAANASGVPVETSSPSRSSRATNSGSCRDSWMPVLQPGHNFGWEPRGPDHAVPAVHHVACDPGFRHLWECRARTRKSLETASALTRFDSMKERAPGPSASLDFHGSESP